MHNYRLMVATDLQFAHATEALIHIGEKMLAEGVVKAGWPAALLEREASFPTGIALEKHAIAIPHCEAEHAREPAIYLIRPLAPVPFIQADDEGYIQAQLIIALIVTEPAEQLNLLRTLFGRLQQSDFIDHLLTMKHENISDYFKKNIFNQHKY